MKIKSHTISIPMIILLVIGFSSCKKYLDIKPDSSLAVPQSLTDCQYLMDNYANNSSYPSDGETAADNFYVTDNNYNALTDVDAKDNYIWAPLAEHATQWSGPYGVIYSANLVLQVLEKLPNTGADYTRVKGTALFYRAFAYYHLAQLFIKPYDNASSGNDLGLPLKLSPDLELKYDRGTVKQTYDRIIQDLKDAVDLLPVKTTVQTRPNKVAAYAALARTYLAMEDYANAGNMANQALALYGTLMDFKIVTTIPRFNPEVIFQAITLSPRFSFLPPTIAKIDPNLYLSYEPNDKRKTVFFKANTGANSGTFGFRGSYDGVANSSIFTGFATDELYLTSAECSARAGNTTEAMNDLNLLLRTRYDVTYVNKTASSPNDALVKILNERRKELIFRNQRWTDLRRLNKDQQFAITLTRSKNTINYTPLKPGDLRYVMLIPTATEVSLSGITQNPR